MVHFFTTNLQTELECDEEGEWFIREQCTTEYCYCVYLDTGDVIVGSEQVFSFSSEQVITLKCQIFSIIFWSAISALQPFPDHVVIRK